MKYELATTERTRKKSGPSWSAVNLQTQFTSLLKQDDVGEPPAYMAAAEDVVFPTEEKKVGWWRGHEEQLPRSASAVKASSLVQPSSATAEGVFSILSVLQRATKLSSC